MAEWKWLLKGYRLAALLTLLAWPFGEARAQGADYVGAYNSLVSNLNHRLIMSGGTAMLCKNGLAGDTVSAADLDAVRKKVRGLMNTLFCVEPHQWQLSCADAAEAFPLGLLYSTNGALIRPSLMEGIGDGEGRFTKVPACYVAGGTNVYAATFDDAPLLKVQFEELDRAIRKLRYVVIKKSAGNYWTSQGTLNQRTGWASHTDWAEMMRKCEASYNDGAPRSKSDFPMAYSSMMYGDALLERRKSAFHVGGLSTNYPHRIRFFIVGSKPALTGNSLSVFDSNGDEISEGVWRKWCETEPVCESNVVSTFFGSFTRPPWGQIPAAGSQSWRGYIADARAVIEWDFPDQAVRMPTFEDKEDDGLLESGCGCKACPVEADPAWRGIRTGTEVVIPLGLSDGALAGGLRVKAYLTEYESQCRTQQMYSLDSKVLWCVYNDGEGWNFASIKRPSGAEILFSLQGAKSGKPVDIARQYEVEEWNGGIRLKFPRQNPKVCHEFMPWPDKNGTLGRVGILRGTNYIYTEALLPNRGQWAGLSTGYSGPFYGNPVTVFTDNRLVAVLTTNSSGLVRQVEYRYSNGGPTNRITYYSGSKGFRALDERGGIMSDVRLAGDSSSGTGEIWTGITTNTGLKVARKEKRRQWVDGGRDLLMVEQTDVINDGTADAASNVTLRAVRCFAWGDEVVEETVGAGSAEARTVRQVYHEDGSDANNYGRLRDRIDPDGGWTRYLYDAAGRESLILTGLKNALPGDTQACHVTEYAYAGDAALEALGVPEVDRCAAGDNRPRLVVEREWGREVSRTYHSYQEGREITLRCVVPGARYDDPGNVASAQSFVTAGMFKGRLARADAPDGSFRMFAYGYDSGRKELTTLEDAGTGHGDVVTNGTRRITVEDARGNLVRETVSAIASGMEIQARRYYRDGLGRETLVTNTVDGSAVASEYGCCGPSRRRDADGMETEYVYDEMKRVYAAESLGVTVYRTYDVLGNVVQTRRVARGGDDVREAARYDSAGRLVQQVNSRGGVTRYEYATNACGERVVTTIHPDGAAVVETSYLDGRTRCVTGSAVHAVSYDYGVDEKGRYAVEYRGADTNAARWVKTWSDMLGHEWRVEHADGHVVETRYDNAGRVVAVTDGYVTQLTGYNGKGEAFRSAVDLDRDGVIGVDGGDRVTEVETGHGLIEGRDARWTRHYVYARQGSDERSLVGEAWQSVDGLLTWSIQAGRTNRTELSRDPVRSTRREVLTSADGGQVISEYTNGLLREVRQVAAGGAEVARTCYEHDDWGRTTAVQFKGPAGEWIRRELEYDVAGNVVLERTGAGGVVKSTRFAYDEMGRRTLAVLADGSEVRYGYMPTGELESQSGAQTTPVRYGYDGQGRINALATFRGEADGQPDWTRWEYDPRRGWVTGKVYADGTTNRYEYRSDGRLVKRISARGIETGYQYDSSGGLTNKTYSDGTEAVGYGLDRLGRVVAIVDGSGVRAFTYDADFRLVEEMLPGGVRLGYGYDAFGRRTNLVVGSAGGVVYEVGYGYDAAGRLMRVEGNGVVAQYDYAADGRSVGGVRLGVGDKQVLRGEREYDEFGYLRRIGWQAGETDVVGREYAVDLLGQRIRCEVGDGAYWEYAYDERGQLTEAGEFTADGEPVAGRQYKYWYDFAGNRQKVQSNQVVMAYVANALNQYDSYEFGGEGGGGAGFWEGSVYCFGGAGDGGEARAVSKQMRQCVHDQDGNLLEDGEWGYAWDAENRLRAASNATTVLSFGYDYMGRRVKKSVYSKVVDAWELAGESTFTYDGWNLVKEEECSSGGEGSRVRHYVWGLDLSGTLEGAGGVGGLLAMASCSGELGGADAGRGVWFYCYDGNGNVAALVGTNGEVCAGYEYDPFGNMVGVDFGGPLTVAGNPFTFSTKYHDGETGLSYYGYRYYSPGSGRWLSRDSLEEQGGVNLYGFVGNQPVGRLDGLGLRAYGCDHDGILEWMDWLESEYTQSEVDHVYNTLAQRDRHIYNPGLANTSADRESSRRLLERTLGVPVEVAWNPTFSRLGRDLEGVGSDLGGNRGTWNPVHLVGNGLGYVLSGVGCALTIGGVSLDVAVAGVEKIPLVRKIEPTYLHSKHLYQQAIAHVIRQPDARAKVYGWMHSEGAIHGGTILDSLSEEELRYVTVRTFGAGGYMFRGADVTHYGNINNRGGRDFVPQYAGMNIIRKKRDINWRALDKDYVHGFESYINAHILEIAKSYFRDNAVKSK